MSAVLCVDVGGKIPEDRTTVEPVLRVVSLSLYVCLCLIASLGILASCVLLAFVWINRHKWQVHLQHACTANARPNFIF